jgi:hypothetical protein
MHEIDMIEAGGFWQLAIGAKAHQRRTHRFNRRASNDAYIDRDMNIHSAIVKAREKRAHDQTRPFVSVKSGNNIPS